MQTEPFTTLSSSVHVTTATAVQMANKIVTKKLPSASITLLGSGVMHWRKDKQIDVIQGTLPAAARSTGI